MSRTAIFLVFVLMFSCDDSSTNPSPFTSTRMVSLVCGKKVKEMKWLSDLIARFDTEINLKGNIYAGTYEDQVIIIHQPLVMSCLACVLYDCEGNKIETSSLDHEKVQSIVSNRNLIYRARYE